MKIKEHYALTSNFNKTESYFESIGPQGTIRKWILFQAVGDNQYNLAFGDYVEGEQRDDSISNNFDFVKVLSTVAIAVYDFLELNPDAMIEIEAVDDKRLRLYTSRQ